VKYVIIDEHGKFSIVTSIHGPFFHDDRYYRKDQTYWLSPVETKQDLPLTGNKHGDTRAVLKEQTLYIWVERQQLDTDGQIVYVGDWLPVIGKYWSAPVETFADLPLTGNSDGEIKLVKDESSLYRWDATILAWQAIVQPSDVTFWKPPVPSFSDLPSTGNFDGDVRLVKDNNGVYRWDAAQSKWIDIHEGMASVLTPKGHDDIQGDIFVPDEKSGFLSNGNSFVKYSAGEQHMHIVNYLPFNSDEIEFGPGDKGTLKLYKNGTLIDSLILSDFFNESERDTNQTSVPWISSNGCIVVTFCGIYENVPYNQYASCHIVFKSSWISPGDNPSIKLVHET